jgi:hypothetical protein
LALSLRARSAGSRDPQTGGELPLDGSLLRSTAGRVAFLAFVALIVAIL